MLHIYVYVTLNKYLRNESGFGSLLLHIDSKKINKATLFNVFACTDGFSLLAIIILSICLDVYIVFYFLFLTRGINNICLKNQPLICHIRVE